MSKAKTTLEPVVWGVLREMSKAPMGFVERVYRDGQPRFRATMLWDREDCGTYKTAKKAARAVYRKWDDTFGDSQRRARRRLNRWRSRMRVGSADVPAGAEAPAAPGVGEGVIAGGGPVPFSLPDPSPAGAGLYGEVYGWRVLCCPTCGHGINSHPLSTGVACLIPACDCRRTPNSIAVQLLDEAAVDPTEA